MSAGPFSRSELADAFERFEQTVARAAESKDWDAWVEHYTPDVLYIEHAAGTMHGRDEVREWIRRTMSTFPGSHMVAFPTLWSVIDEPTGRIILELDNPMKDPGDGSVIGEPNISIITYAGDGLWRQQEEHLQPAAIRAGLVEVVPQGAGTGHPRRGRRALPAAVRSRPVTAKPKLVLGANGFLGSHVTRQLVAAGAQVRAMVREGANTRSIDDLDVTRCSRFYGDVFDTATVRAAMDGVDDVYYCVVDTRAWLRDPAPLFRTNVEGLRNVLDVAVNQPDLRKFVFTSTYTTVGRRHGHVATEDDVIGSRGLTPYVKSRVQAENMVMRYVADAGLPAVAMCVSTTYGDGDWGGTPHGAFIAGAVFGKLPFLMNGIQLEVVGVDDAARALILAAERGRSGERYLISEKMMALNDSIRIAADEAGVQPPQRAISVPMLYALAAAGTLKAKLTGTDAQLSLASVRMMRAEAPVDCSKARRELGWQPRPVEESIREAARFWAAMRTPRTAA